MEERHDFRCFDELLTLIAGKVVVEMMTERGDEKDKVQLLVLHVTHFP